MRVAGTAAASLTLPSEREKEYGQVRCFLLGKGKLWHVSRKSSGLGHILDQGKLLCQGKL